jgi:hypothetical protein
MRKLTLKDFLSFYTPCLSCDAKNILTWIVNYKTPKVLTPSNVNLGEFVPTLNGKLLEIDLKVTYFNKFSFMIDIVSHSFISSDAAQFLEYLGETNCYIQLKCAKCNSQVISNHLEFDTNRRLLKPITIKGEQWHITDEENFYNVYTNMDKDESEIIVDKINSTTPLTPWRKVLEAIPINRFNSKDDFLDRIKTYMVFS